METEQQEYAWKYFKCNTQKVKKDDEKKGQKKQLLDIDARVGNGRTKPFLMTCSMCVYPGSPCLLLRASLQTATTEKHETCHMLGKLTHVTKDKNFPLIPRKLCAKILHTKQKFGKEAVPILVYEESGTTRILTFEKIFGKPEALFFPSLCLFWFFLLLLFIPPKARTIVFLSDPDDASCLCCTPSQ